MEDLTRAAKHYFGAEGYEKYKQESHRTGESPEELYIRMAKISIRKCNNVVCRAILAGFYFCCTECENYDGYTLCLNCFYNETVKHQHDSFADNHSILTMAKKGSRYPPCVIQKKPKGKGLQQPPPVPVQVQQTKELEKGKGKQDLQIVAKPYYARPPAETKILLEGRAMVVNEGMEKLGRIARAHHKAASREIKNAADAFRRSMFRQAGNGHSLTQNEFLAVMKTKGYPQYADKDLFRMLAKDKHHLTMSEALTLYYIVLSGRPFCSGCEQFIPDIFFCCSKCPAAKYALCLGCYEGEAYLRHKSNKHVGENDVFFLDYTVLHTGCFSAAPTPQSPNLQTDDEARPEPSNAIVKKDKRTELMTTFSTVLTTCTAALNFATAFCTIM